MAKDPLPETSSKTQGGGDREEATPSGPATVPRAPLNMAEENWYLEPNKVQFMDGPDTFRTNVGRHRVPPLRLLRAKTFPHLVFADPPASPDGEKNVQDMSPLKLDITLDLHFSLHIMPYPTLKAYISRNNVYGTKEGESGYKPPRGSPGV